MSRVPVENEAGRETEIWNRSENVGRPGSASSPHHSSRAVIVQGCSLRFILRQEFFPVHDKREKALVTCPPGNLGGKMERFCGDNDSQRGFSDAVRFLRNLGSRQKLVFYTVLDESKTLYLPYGWVHYVITLFERDEGGSFVCSMWYLELPTDENKVAAFKRKAL